ncbi:MAG: SDR family oxidoreductase, partial [Pseudomonadota bacterium]
VDILVNAHRDLQSSDPLNPDCTAFEELYTTNVLTPLRLSKTFASRLIQQAEGTDEDTPAGAIVNVTSIASRLTLPDLVAYSVAAAAVDQMTRSLAVAYAKYRIRVNAIALGSVMSSSLQSALKDDGSLHEELRAATPLGRIGEADEAAEVAMFLASQAASFVTGQIVAVDGGRTMLDSLDTPAH